MYAVAGTDEHGRPTVIELVRSRRRLYPVGRLDADSTGLILVTNDGELADRLTHPRYGVDKVYRARISPGRMAPRAIQMLREGVDLEDGKTAPGPRAPGRAGDWWRSCSERARSARCGGCARPSGTASWSSSACPSDRSGCAGWRSARRGADRCRGGAPAQLGAPVRRPQAARVEESAGMRLRALRGAITVDENEVDAIVGATEELVREVIDRNELEPDDLVSCIFTCTDDLDAEFPALAARRLGLDALPLLCAREIGVPGSLPRVIRLLVHCYPSPSRRRGTSTCGRPCRSGATSRGPSDGVEFNRRRRGDPGLSGGSHLRLRRRAREARLQRDALGPAPARAGGDRGTARARSTAIRTRDKSLLRTPDRRRGRASPPAR